MGTDKQVSRYDIVEKEWVVFSSAKEATRVMKLKGAAVAVAKLQKSIVRNRYFFCDTKDAELYTDEIIMDRDKRMAVEVEKRTIERTIAVYDIRRADLGWQVYDSLKKAAKSIDMSLSTLNKAIRDNGLYEKRYIIAYESEHQRLDIKNILELPLEDDRYYVWPTNPEEREELFRRLQIGKYHPKYNTTEKIKELMIWANEQAEEANDDMRRKINEKMLERYNTTSTIVAGMKKKGDVDEIEGMDMEDIDDEEPLGDEE
jgi:hypothetical protein